MHAHAFRASLRREWQLLRRRPWDLAMVSWVPLLSIALIWWMFSNGIPTRLPIGVWDADHSALSRQLIRLLDATPGLRVVAHYDDERQTEHALRAGSVYGAVEIPRDFARDVKRGHAAQVTLLHNAQFSSHSGVIQRDVRTATGTLSAGIEIAARTKRGEAARAARVAAEPIRTSLANLFNPSLDYLQFLGMALIPALLHIFAMAAGAWAVGTELRDAALGDWQLACAQGRPDAPFFAALLGKLSMPFLALSATGIAGMLAVIVGGGMHPAGSLPFTLLALAVMLALSIALGAAVAAVTRSLRTALSVTGIVTAPAFAFSGAAFPLSAMPASARLWADSLPFTHYLRVQIEQLQMGAPLAYSLPILIWMPAVTLALLAVASRGLANAARQPASWGGAMNRGVFLQAWIDTLKAVVRDQGALLFLVVAPLFYGFFYPWPFSTQVVTRVPVAVVDLDHSSLSRQITRFAQASPRLDVALVTADEHAAQQALWQGKIEGYAILPRDLKRNVLRGESAVVPVEGNGAYLLLNKTVLTGFAEAVGTVSAGIEIKKLQSKGQSARQAASSRSPVNLQLVALFNPDEGYGNYAVPAVAIIIIQQTLLMGVALLVGTWVENATQRAGVRAWLGRIAAFSTFGLFMGLLYLGWIFAVHEYPRAANVWGAVLLLLVFIPAVATAGALAGLLLANRERAIQVLLFTSIPMAFLSGFSWPGEALPVPLQWLRWLIPSTAGIQASLRLNQMGAGIADVAGYLALLAALGLACGTALCIRGRR